MTSNKTQKLCLAALFTALTCVATMLIAIPSPIGGYIHPGDAFVLLGAFLLGPAWGAVAGGVGSMLSDLLLGYAVYAPGTLVIKAVMGALAGLILRKCAGTRPILSAALAAAASEAVMVAGYFTYSAYILGYGPGASAEIPGNLVQALFGTAASCAIFYALHKSHALQNLSD